ncbi:polysaccharide deacetylase family protein [Pseudoxanthomonas sp. PXM02]|uniref:polysaccharide deacetylase family protein n=1 Tax=Pseudoxanthomonas sp. PXM02 TaxID=2769294 RepID=UPI00177ADE99|nr:polysaccharide deacetylase family protein [Pseudoxanthomonas sp. PXM02]MBD9479113.1 polysaccharide deacetylase family protein [Pseudoxanthomonas sp. PXM02]
MSGALRFVLVALAAVAGTAQAADPFPWPGGRKAAVSLAYDDAPPSQLDNAIPALDRHGLKGSFYLTLASDTLRTRQREWVAAARNGHELGNHTLFHQCSASLPDRSWVAPQRNLDTTTVAQMADQVRMANVMLTALDGRTVRTMTVPCGDTQAADGNYVDAIASEFVAIKRGSGGVIADMATLDPAAVPVDVPVDVTGEQLIARVEEAARRGTMVGFTFHGIGGDHLAVSREAHEQLLQHLAAHPDVYWVAPFVDIMQYVATQRSQAAASRP